MGPAISEEGLPKLGGVPLRTIASVQVKPMRYHPIFVVLLMMISSGAVQAADRLTRECEFEVKARYAFGKERNDDARM